MHEHRERFGVEPICKALGVSASAFYQRATGQRSPRQLEDERLLEKIRETHKKNYEAYGYRRTWKALLRAGEQVPRCQVQRLMAANGIRGAKRRGKPWRTTTPDSGAARRPDLVERDFTAERPNELWVADFSYLRCWEGVVFFSFVIDVYSRKIVGWQFAGHMRTTLVLDALRMALSTRERVEEFRLVHHSDRGGQYVSGDYTQTLTDNDVLASVGSTGDAYDKRDGRELRRQLQDRADRRPRLAQSQPSRARDRRVHQLVQRQPLTRKPRRPATLRDRGTLR